MYYSHSNLIVILFEGLLQSPDTLVVVSEGKEAPDGDEPPHLLKRQPVSQWWLDESGGWEYPFDEQGKVNGAVKERFTHTCEQVDSRISSPSLIRF